VLNRYNAIVARSVKKWGLNVQEQSRIPGSLQVGNRHLLQVECLLVGVGSVQLPQGGCFKCLQTQGDYHVEPDCHHVVWSRSAAGAWIG
jgi:hypothetical protein